MLLLRMISPGTICKMECLHDKNFVAKQRKRKKYLTDVHVSFLEGLTIEQGPIHQIVVEFGWKLDDKLIKTYL